MAHILSEKLLHSHLICSPEISDPWRLRTSQPVYPLLVDLLKLEAQGEKGGIVEDLQPALHVTQFSIWKINVFIETAFSDLKTQFPDVEFSIWKINVFIEKKLSFQT